MMVWADSAYSNTPTPPFLAAEMAALTERGGSFFGSIDRSRNT